MCKNKSNNLLDSNKIKVQILTKNLILKHLFMYRTIRTILRYDTIHTIYTLYRTIHEHLQYADTIRNLLPTIRYVAYDTYRVSYDTDNYAFNYNIFYFQ